MKEQIKKFDTSIVIIKEHITFLKYPEIQELKDRHGVDFRLIYTVETLLAILLITLLRTKDNSFMLPCHHVTFTVC